MKFTNGYWLNRDEYIVNSPLEAFDAMVVEKDDDNYASDDLRVYSACHRINSRSDILDVGATTMTVFSPAEDVIGVELKHFDRDDKNPLYELQNNNVTPAIEIADSVATLTSGDLQLAVSMHDKLNIDFNYKGKHITGSEYKTQASIDDFSGKQLGQVMHANTDGGTGSEQSYKSIPFYMTGKAGVYYSVFVNESQPTSFEVGSEVVDRVSFSTRGESLEYYVIAGDSPKSVISKYNKLTGGSVLPSEWTFGLWLSTSFTTDYSEETVMSFIDGMFERDIPVSVFHFDCFWMKGFEWSNMEWDKEQFPDPVGLLKRLHDKGLKACVWINPYISQKSPLFKIGKEKGYFIKHTDGSVWQWDLWQPGNAVVDFTNPEARAWYQGLLKNLLDMGVDCFKKDFGERIPMHDAVFFNGDNFGKSSTRVANSCVLSQPVLVE